MSFNKCNSDPNPNTYSKYKDFINILRRLDIYLNLRLFSEVHVLQYAECNTLTYHELLVLFTYKILNKLLILKALRINN